jgi:hypothetical protein
MLVAVIIPDPHRELFAGKDLANESVHILPPKRLTV